MRYKSHKGWYALQHPEKFIKPLDEYMESFTQRNGVSYIQYKSMLERIAFRYADMNPKIVKFSIEPFNIKYIKPTGNKFIVEIKSKGETQTPKKPKILNEKNAKYYKDSIETYLVNQAKWKSATEFAKNQNMKFIILTEDQLKS